MLKIWTNGNNQLPLLSSLDDLKKKIIVPIDHRATVENLIEQDVCLFAEKDTNLEKTNTIKMSLDTG